MVVLSGWIVVVRGFMVGLVFCVVVGLFLVWFVFLVFVWVLCVALVAFGVFGFGVVLGCALTSGTADKIFSSQRQQRRA